MFLSLALLGPALGDYSSVQRKFDLIEAGRLPSGSRVVFGQDELNAYVQRQAAVYAPEGVRDPKVELGDSTASGFAYIDFPKLRESQGKPMGWLASRLFSGERPVRVDTRIRSAAGQATVDVERVEVSGISISGAALDYLIQNYLYSYFPTAKVGQPFGLAHRIERLEVAPGQARVVIGR